MLKQDRSLVFSLADDTLREIERALRGRLRSHHVSESFIARCEDDSIQKAFAEYLRAVAEGRKIENRDAFIVDVAFKRAVDEIRAEVRHGDPATLAAIVDRSGGPAPAAEEEATEHLLAAELHQAIDQLSAEKRQALRLYYFEEKTISECAELLFVSETGFRRVLRSAISMLRRHLGVELPDPEKPLGLEVGLAAWVATGGALTPMASGVADGLVAFTDSLRHGLGSVVAKLRDLAWRAPPNGSEAGLRTLLASPAGRVAGVCAGVAACALGGAVIESGKSTPQSDPAPAVMPAKVVAHSPTPPPPLAPRHRPDGSSVNANAKTDQERASHLARSDKPDSGDSTAVTAVGSSHRAPRVVRNPEVEEVQAEEQFSGIAQAESESTEPTSSEVQSPAPKSEAKEQAPAPSLNPQPKPSGSQASEEAQVEEQFGAMK